MLRFDVIDGKLEAGGTGVAERGARPGAWLCCPSERSWTHEMNITLRRPSVPVRLPSPSRPRPAIATPVLAPVAARARAEELTEHMPRLRSVIRRILLDEADTEDVLQDVMCTALQKLSTFRGDAQLGTWLHRIAVNTALIFRRRRSNLAKMHETRADDAYLGVKGPSAPARRRTLRPDQESVRGEGARLIEAAIAKLPPMYREVYLLADLDELPNEAIAQRLGLKLPAVKSRLHRARKMMRDQLAPHFEGQR